MDMRKVRFTPRRPDWVGDPDIMTGARYQHRLTRSVDLGAGRVEPVWSPMRLVNGVSAELDLPVTPVDLSWAVEVYCEMPDGRGGLLKTSEVVQVPAGSYSTVLEFENLTRVDRSSLQPIVTAPSALELRLQAVEAAVGSGVGTGGAPAGTGTAGRYRVGDLEDITAVGEDVGTAADKAAGRAAIDAAPKGTRTTPAGAIGVADLGITGTPTGTKFLADNGTWAVPSGTPAALDDWTDVQALTGYPAALDDIDAKVEIGGDLSGAAATPTVAKVRGVAVSATAPSAGQVLVATSPTAAQWQGAASSIAIAGMPPGSVIAVRKDSVTGFWPASWDSAGLPVYTGGSASAGVRPTSRGDICVQWIGQSPHPPIVSSGTAGCRDGVDLRTVLP